MLQVDNVSFGYASTWPWRAASAARPVLTDVSFDVARGSRVGILGPNGSGKTTLLKIVDGLLKPWRGRVSLDGADLASLSRRALARQMAVVPQQTHSVFDFTALDIVLMGRYPHLSGLQFEDADDMTIATDAMTATRTIEFADRPFHTLSGGEQQRVVIAGALAQGSNVLLLDEPTASLDLGSQMDIAALLLSLAQTKQTTIVLSTHDLNLAAAVCSHLVLLSGGRVIAAGPTDQVLTAAAVRTVYGVDADVHRDPVDAQLRVIPRARPR